MEVLIHAGAGGVGSLAIQIAKARGAQVTATCSARNADLVASFGADRVIAYDRVPFEKQVGDVDVVFDTMGGDVHRRSYEVLKRGGMMVCLAAEPIVDLSAEYGVTVVQAPILPRSDILDSLLGMAAEPGSFGSSSSRCCRSRNSAARRNCRRADMCAGRSCLQLRGPNGSPIG